MRINYKEKEIFKFKFNRDPKLWTIKEIHSLYLRAFDRHHIRHNKLLDIKNRILNELGEGEEDRVVYFERNCKTYKRTFTYYSQFDGWASKSELINFKLEKNVNRDDKLDLILANSKQFELGELFESLKNSNNFLHTRIWEVLSEMVENSLRKKFKGKKLSDSDVLTISISGIKYYVICDISDNIYYKKFVLKNREVENIEL